MDLFQSFVLGALQGITEFLPISSSGHLVLGEEFFGLDAANLKSFDVVVHMGTLLAILIYFWKDVWGMMKAFLRFFAGRVDRGDPYVTLIGFVLVGTVPAVFMGVFGEGFIDGYFRGAVAVAGWMIFVGIVFVLGEWVYGRFWKSKGAELSARKALVIGFAQALALIPGVSRSGATIVAGLFQGIDRSAAARFSFLLGVPAIAGAGILTGMKIVGDAIAVSLGALIVGFLSSFVFGILSVGFLMKFLKKHSLMVFAVYLIVLGISVIVIFYQ